MNVIKCKNYEEFSKKAADILAEQIISKPACVLGLPTGSTGVGMYASLAQRNLDFGSVTTFNLDEYYGLEKTHNQSYWYFMNKNLYSKVNLKPENTNIPSGVGENIEEAAHAYDESIAEKGGIDIMVLGIGNNGHIGFNEPCEKMDARTHVVTLTDKTIEANSRFFERKEDVPTKAVTMGLGSIMKAKHILMLISGKNKEQVTRELLNNFITTQNPSTMLLMHPNVTVLIDESAVKI